MSNRAKKGDNPLVSTLQACISHSRQYYRNILSSYEIQQTRSSSLDSEYAMMLMVNDDDGQ